MTPLRPPCRGTSRWARPGRTRVPRSRRLHTLLGLAVAIILAAQAPTAHAIPRDDADGGGVVITDLETQWHPGQGELHMGSVFNNGNGGWGLLAESDVMWTDDAGKGRSASPGPDLDRSRPHRRLRPKPRSHGGRVRRQLAARDHVRDRQ
jgi:hypothetical protein